MHCLFNKVNLLKEFSMALQVEDLEDQTKYRQILEISYDDLVPFILDYLRRKSSVTIFFWSACIIFLVTALRIRMNIGGYFAFRDILTHSVIGMIFLPLVCIPLHELLHVVPYYFSGARKIRVGMDLKQYLFYVTAHRHVATPRPVQDYCHDPIYSDNYWTCIPDPDIARIVEMEPLPLPLCPYNYVCRRFCAHEFLPYEKGKKDLYMGRC